jgi:hypothetical protein
LPVRRNLGKERQERQFGISDQSGALPGRLMKGLYASVEIVIKIRRRVLLDQRKFHERVSFFDSPGSSGNLRSWLY